MGIENIALSLFAIMSTILSFVFTLIAKETDSDKNGRYIMLAFIFGVTAIILLVVKLGITRPNF